VDKKPVILTLLFSICFPIFSYFSRWFCNFWFFQKNRNKIGTNIVKKWRWPRRSLKRCWKNLETWKIAKTAKIRNKNKKPIKTKMEKIKRQNHVFFFPPIVFPFFLGGFNPIFFFFLLILWFPWFPKGAWNRQTYPLVI
jgi:hypothetical protein